MARSDAGAPEPRRPVVLAKGLTPSGSALGLDATWVYWIDQAQGLSRAPKAGGTPTQHWADTRDARLGEDASIAIDEANVYFTFNTSDATEPGRQRLVRQSKVDGSTQVLVDLRGGSVAGLVVDEANAYWVQNGFIMRAAKQGSGRAAPIASGQMARPVLAIDEGRVYWVSYVADERFVIRAAPKAGGASSVVVKNIEHARALLVDATHVYWTSGTKIMAASKTGGAPVQLVDARSWIAGIAIDAAHLYFTVPGDIGSMSAEGTVWRVAKDGSTTTLLASGQKHPTGIAVDGASLYWASQGALSKLEKPPRSAN